MSRIVVLFFVLGFATNSFAARQNTQPVLSKNDNVIGPEDTLNIVAGEAEEISKTWRVSANGDLALPMIGHIHAAGLTVAQLEEQIAEKLKAFIREPHVSVYISEFRSQPVTIEGAVAKPGTIQTEGPKTLLNVLMMAGGPNAAGPTVILTRKTKNGSIPLDGAKTDANGEYSTVELKLKDVMNASSPAANLIMRPHDVLSVSTKQRLVYIIGQVNRPGAVELDTQDSVSAMQVLAAAGGLTSLAVPSNTAIMHVDEKGQYSKVASINLKSVMNGKGADRMLTPGDIVVVPENHIKSYVQAATMSATTSGMYAILMHF
ncbi:MAG: polysaccharide export protein [Candidatus Acidoferrum typicum]|nr:polysaccharide export protein [Candidatus Acidoferrum typicum]